MKEFVQLSNCLADVAGEIARQYYRQPFTVEKKDDDSPVTIADRTIEHRIREILEKERPEDGILGEEFGPKDSQNGLTWVIDPIDGTKSFVMGRPTFGTLIALCEDDKPILGVIDQGILKERWIGIRGEETTFNGSPIRSRPCSSLDQAVISSTSPSMFNDYDDVHKKLDGNCKMAWGGDCYMYGLLASGYNDVAVEACLSPYDFAALVPVVEGAGGWIGDWDGNPLTLQSDGRVLAVGDPALKDDIIALLN